MPGYVRAQLTIHAAQNTVGTPCACETVRPLFKSHQFFVQTTNRPTNHLFDRLQLRELNKTNNLSLLQLLSNH